MAARGGGIRLGEFVEKALQFICRDADAAVLDTDTQRDLSSSDRVGFHIDEHMTLIREFDGIVGQIRQDLADTPHIAKHIARHIRRITHNDIDIILSGRLHRDHAPHLFNSLEQVKRVWEK